MAFNPQMDVQVALIELSRFCHYLNYLIVQEQKVLILTHSKQRAKGFILHMNDAVHLGNAPKQETVHTIIGLDDIRLITEL